MHTCIHTSRVTPSLATHAKSAPQPPSGITFGLLRQPSSGLPPSPRYGHGNDSVI